MQSILLTCHIDKELGAHQIGGFGEPVEPISSFTAKRLHWWCCTRWWRWHASRVNVPRTGIWETITPSGWWGRLGEDTTRPVRVTRVGLLFGSSTHTHTHTHTQTHPTNKWQGLVPVNHHRTLTGLVAVCEVS